MKKIIIIISICLLLVSCGKIQRKTPVITETPSVVVSLATTTSTLRSIVTSTKSSTKISQSMDDEEFSYSTHTPMPSQGCQEILIEDYSSLQEIQGTIPLIGTTYKFKDSYLLDLSTKQKILLQGEQNEFIYSDNEITSPNGKWFAYMPQIDKENQFVIITNSKGVLEKKIFLPSIINPIHMIRLMSWVDNENLLLVWPRDNSNGIISPDQAITVILNPFTGEWHEYNSTYPDIYTSYPNINYLWDIVSLSTYNQSLDRVLYLSNEGVVLWDLMNQKQIKLFSEVPEYSGIQPAWSPDGSSFVIDLDTESGRNLFLVSKDGEEKQITFMKGYESKNINDYSWSPDGKSIAFWLFRKFDKQEVFYYYDLNVLNLSTQEIQSFCITAYNWRKSYSDWYPIWSPDGKYLVVAAANETDLTRSMAVLIDLVNEKAYKIADDVAPVGWMVSE